MHDFAWVYIFVGPIHFGNVNQTFDALFNFYECAVVGEVRHFAEQARTLRIAACQTFPWVFTQLFQAQRHALFVLVKAQYFGFHFFAHFQHFAWVFYATPCKVGDVQQAVDAAQIYECAVVGDVFHDAFYDGAFLQGFHQGFALFAQSGFQHGAA